VQQASTSKSIPVKKLVNETGQVVGIIISVQDISAAKQAEYELVQTKRRLEEAQRISHIGSIEYEAETGRLYWSEEAFHIHGYDPETTVAETRRWL
jgi:PAS domain-containing protein